MTIIEFFDAKPIQNIASTLLLRPHTVVLVGAQSAPMYAFRTRLEKITKARGLDTKIDIVQVDIQDFAALSKKLEGVLLSYRDCVFDLTGGQTEILVAMGALSEKYGLPMHTVDPITKQISPLTFKETYPAPEKAEISITENIALYGGRVTEALIPPKDGAYWKDVLAVWAVCAQDPSGWNSAISALHAFCAPEEMFAELKMRDVYKKFAPHRAETLRKTIHALQSAGVLTGYREKADYISFRYKNEAVQTALLKEGSVLELFVYYAAFVLEEGNAPFTDGASGVEIDWDTIPSPFARDDVKNEIDVFLMQGLIPVFISCKNGFVDSDELYKLSVVASRFGAPYAKKILVLTGHIPDTAFLDRAKELSITVLEGVHLKEPSALGEDIQKATKA